MCRSLRYTPPLSLVQLAALALLLLAHPAHPRPELDAATNAPGRRLASTPRYSHISVIGERNSGTNFVRKLLETNLAPEHAVLERFTQHKHYMQEPPPQPAPHHLIVVCARNAYDWALSMQYKCYCCNKREREDFVRFVTEPYVATEYPHEYCPNQDLDISRGNQPFRNLMDMRAQKIKNHLGLSEWTGGVALVRLEDIFTKNDSIRWLVSFTTQYNLTFQPSTACPTGTAACYAASSAAALKVDEGDARAWHAHKAASAAARVAASVYLNRAQLNVPTSAYYKHRDKVSIINSVIDRDVEARLGYKILAAGPPPEGASPP